MFGNNPFLTKKDPLVQAVMEARKDGDMRRQAEALVNEQFGVYSRKAVIRENLAAYDAALESTYLDLKEGKKPNDGNLANNYPPYDKVTRGDVVAGRLGKDQMGGKKKMGEGLDVVPRDYSGKSTVTQDRDPKATSYDKTLPKEYPGAASSTAPNNPTSQRMQNMVKEDGVTAPKDWAMKRQPNKGAVVKAPVPGVSIAEGVSRKHFQQVADLIKGHESQEKRNELASHHAGIFAKQNPRFNHEKFHAAAGSTAHQPKTVKESVLAAVRAKFVKEDQSF
jgi:hypothetical protein